MRLRQAQRSHAIARGRAYVEAGADVLLVEAPQSVEELKAIATAFPDVPLVANMVEGGKTPQLSASELQEIGFKIVFFPVSTLLAATQVMTACLRHLKAQGTTAKFEDLVTFKEFEQLIGVPKYRQLEPQFAVDNHNRLSERQSTSYASKALSHSN